MGTSCFHQHPILPQRPERMCFGHTGVESHSYIRANYVLLAVFRHDALKNNTGDTDSLPAS